MLPRRATSVTEPATLPSSTYALQRVAEPLEALRRQPDAVRRRSAAAIAPDAAAATAEQDENRKQTRAKAWRSMTASFPIRRTRRQHTGAPRRSATVRSFGARAEREAMADSELGQT